MYGHVWIDIFTYTCMYMHGILYSKRFVQVFNIDSLRSLFLLLLFSSIVSSLVTVSYSRFFLSCQNIIELFKMRWHEVILDGIQRERESDDVLHSRYVNRNQCKHWYFCINWYFENQDIALCPIDNWNWCRLIVVSKMRNVAPIYAYRKCYLTILPYNFHSHWKTLSISTFEMRSKVICLHISLISFISAESTVSIYL